MTSKCLNPIACSKICLASIAPRRVFLADTFFSSIFTGAYLVFLVLGPRQVTKGQTILNQPSNSPDTTCGTWYKDTGTCAYYTFGCNLSPIPVTTLPTCFTGTMQSPIHLNQADAVVASVDPGTVTFTGYSDPLNPVPVLRAVGYTLQLDQEATLKQLGGKKITTKQVFDKRRKTKKTKNRKNKRKHKKSREKRSFNDWMELFAGRQGPLGEKPSVTGGPLQNDRSVLSYIQLLREEYNPYNALWAC